MNKLIKTIFLLSFIALSFSCTTYKKVVYVQEDETQKKEFYQNRQENYKINQGDILYIKVVSGDEEIDRKFSIVNEGMNQTGNSNERGSAMYYSGFFVNDSGNVNLPVMGEVHVQGLTILNAEKKIQEHIDQYLQNALVIVKLTSIHFTILGMINSPGLHTAYNNKLTVFDAISISGDIPLDGIRYKINILRSTEKGVKKLTLDLTDIGIIESEGYYVMNNDIIYIEPRKRFFLRNDIKDYLLVVGSASSLVTAIVLVANFGIQ